MENIIKKLTEGCTGNCRIVMGTASTTAMFYRPTYDKNGVNINPDMNTTTGICSCVTCCKNWKYSSRGEEVGIKQFA